METEEIEAAMERIWDLHDKVSDAIHSVSRAHFFHSIRTGGGGGGGRISSVGKSLRAVGGGGGNGGGGFVFVKGLVEEDEEGMVAEARNLHLIRTALENLEDQLEFLHVSNQKIKVFFLLLFMVWRIGCGWILAMNVCCGGMGKDWVFCDWHEEKLDCLEFCHYKCCV